METKVTQLPPKTRLPLNLAKLGSIALIIGAFFSWGVADTENISGLEGDGIITLIIGLVTLIILHIGKISLWYSLLLGLVAEFIVISQSISVFEKIKEAKEILATSLIGPDITGNIGIGAYITMVGGALVVFGTLIQWIKNRK